MGIGLLCEPVQVSLSCDCWVEGEEGHQGRHNVHVGGLVMGKAVDEGDRLKPTVSLMIGIES